MNWTPELQTRVEAYAVRKRISTDDALVALLDAGLRASERAAAAGAIGGTWQRKPSTPTKSTRKNAR